MASLNTLNFVTVESGPANSSTPLEHSAIRRDDTILTGRVTDPEVKSKWTYIAEHADEWLREFQAFVTRKIAGWPSSLECDLDPST